METAHGAGGMIIPAYIRTAAIENMPTLRETTTPMQRSVKPGKDY